MPTYSIIGTTPREDTMTIANIHPERCFHAERRACADFTSPQQRLVCQTGGNMPTDPLEKARV